MTIHKQRTLSTSLIAEAYREETFTPHLADFTLLREIASFYGIVRGLASFLS
jgi:hypothetical protein